MRFLVVGRPKFPLPLEQLPALLDAESGWYSRHRDRIEVHGWFIGGGGFVIVNVEDEATLNQLVMEHPFTPFSDAEVQPFVDHDTGIRQLAEAVRAATGA
jgi:hypothetical protein